MTNEEYLEAIALRITEVFGLNYLPSQFADLERRLKLAANEFLGEATLEGIFTWLTKGSLSNNEFKLLASHLTIGETYFFREKCGLDLLVELIIPRLIKERTGKKEELKIWCAGCSSGEEPYTIAILLKERFPELNHWNVSILATDINPDAICKATKGEYTEWSFRDTDPVIRNKYFQNDGKYWRINTEIKKLVVFTYLNLSGNSYPSPITCTNEIDVLFCRNVLMYFPPKVISEVSNRFYQAISSEGWLIVSQVELNNDYFGLFKRVLYKNGIFYQKQDNYQGTSDFENKLVDNNMFLSVKTKPHKREEIARKVKAKSVLSRPASSKAKPVISDKHQLNQLFQEGRYQDCISECCKIIDNKELDLDLFFLLIKSYANTGNSEEGIEIIDRILEGSSVTPEMYFIYANFLQEHGNEKYAEVILNKAIYLDQSHVLSHFLLGELLLKRNKIQAALKRFETVAYLLDQCDPNEVIPETDGITMSSFKDLTRNILNKIYE